MGPALLTIALACSGGSLSGPDQPDPPGPAARLADCPSQISQPLFTALPMDPADFIAFRPLGWLSPPTHVFPAKHHSFTMALPGQPSPKKPVRAPGTIWVTEVWRIAFSSGGTNYQVYFQPCRQFRGYFFHLSSIAAKLESALASSSPACDAFGDGIGGTITRCRHQQLEVGLLAGEPLGIGTDAAGVDFGATDQRAQPAGFIRPEHYPSDYGQYVSPVDYFSAEVKAALVARLGSVFGTRPRTADPLVGSYMQDRAGTAQGNWFRPGFYWNTGGDIAGALALVHDYVDPAQPVFSVGNSIPGLAMGLYSFVPRTAGRVNRNFGDVSADGSVFCYESFLSGQTAGGVGLGNPRGIVLIRLPTPTTLQVERQGNDGTLCGDPATWTFTAASVSFER